MQQRMDQQFVSNCQFAAILMRCLQLLAAMYCNVFDIRKTCHKPFRFSQLLLRKVEWLFYFCLFYNVFPLRDWRDKNFVWNF